MAYCIFLSVYNTMEQAKYVSARMMLSSCIGAIGGVGVALYKGHRSIPRTAGMMAFSCAMSATACFGTERLAHLALAPLLEDNLETAAPPISTVTIAKTPTTLESMLVTHALGGFFGGALLGGLFIGRPLRGSVFFTPLMLLIAAGEHRLQLMRAEILDGQKGQA